MNPRRFVALATFLLVVAASSAQAVADEPFFLKDGDRVVFYGDSITDQRLYTTFTETFAVTRFPRMNLTFVHSGWGGDTVGGGGGGPIDVRLRRDVIAHKPTVVTVMLGMNDASYRAFDQAIFDTYTKGYVHLVSTLKQAIPGLRMTLIAPSPFDDVTRPPTFEGGYNAVLVRYGQFVKELAAKEGVGFADLNTLVVAATKKANETDAAKAQQLNFDRVHPGPGGQLLMAAALLRAWNAPALVSAIEIDGEAGKLIRGDNTKVSELTVNNNAISWTQEDAALPMAIDMSDPIVALAVRSSDVMQTLNQQTLKVTGARIAEYQLKIDGEDLGKFTKEKLADGLNLAELTTPMFKQAQRVHDLTVRHNNIHFVRWREIQVPLESEDAAKVAKATEALDAIEADLVQHQRAAAQPRPHKFELIPQM
jgi:lysophospholipase L1-like esterase